MKWALGRLRCYTDFIEKACFLVRAQLLIQSESLFFRAVLPEKGVAGEIKAIQHKARLKDCNQDRADTYSFKISRAET